MQGEGSLFDSASCNRRAPQFAGLAPQRCTAPPRRNCAAGGACATLALAAFRLGHSGPEARLGRAACFTRSSVSVAGARPGDRRPCHLPSGDSGSSALPLVPASKERTFRSPATARLGLSMMDIRLTVWISPSATSLSAELPTIESPGAAAALAALGARATRGQRVSDCRRQPCLRVAGAARARARRARRALSSDGARRSACVQ